MKILGINFTYNWRLKQEFNFDVIFHSKKILKCLAMEEPFTYGQSPTYQNMRRVFNPDPI